MKKIKDPLSKLKLPTDKLPKLKLPNIPNMPNLGDLSKVDLSKIVEMLKSLASPGGPLVPSRPMKYPYTFSAKIAQFPYMHYYKNCWMARYYVWGVLCSLPIFWKISRLSNSKANKEKWAEIRRKEREEHRH